MPRSGAVAALGLAVLVLAAPGAFAVSYSLPEPPQPPAPPEPPGVPEDPEDPAAGTSECKKINGWNYCIHYKAVPGCDLYVLLGGYVMGCAVKEMPV